MLQREMGFTRLRVLILPNNFGTDWIGVGADGCAKVDEVETARGLTFPVFYESSRASANAR